MRVCDVLTTVCELPLVARGGMNSFKNNVSSLKRHLIQQQQHHSESGQKWWDSSFYFIRFEASTGNTEHVNSCELIIIVYPVNTHRSVQTHRVWRRLKTENTKHYVNLKKPRRHTNTSPSWTLLSLLSLLLQTWFSVCVHQSAGSITFLGSSRQLHDSLSKCHNCTACTRTGNVRWLPK